MQEIDWLRDSRSFDRVAALYDTYRPEYPDQLVTDILTITHFPDQGRILEIGSGTGKATLKFARRGCSILCIEPGANMAGVARRILESFPRVDFRITAFEEWDNEGELFDLVISGQAFHWIPPEVRYLKTAQILKQSGYLAIFWNWNLPRNDRLSEQIHRVYEQYVPELTQEEPRSHEDTVNKWVREIRTCQVVDLVAVQRYPWEKEYPTRQYLGMLNTHSDHLRLTEEGRQQLFTALGEVLEEAGGSIKMTYECVAFIARKSRAFV